MPGPLSIASHLARFSCALHLLPFNFDQLPSQLPASRLCVSVCVCLPCEISVALISLGRSVFNQGLPNLYSLPSSDRFLPGQVDQVKEVVWVCLCPWRIQTKKRYTSLPRRASHFIFDRNRRSSFLLVPPSTYCVY